MRPVLGSIWRCRKYSATACSAAAKNGAAASGTRAVFSGSFNGSSLAPRGQHGPAKQRRRLVLGDLEVEIRLHIETAAVLELERLAPDHAGNGLEQLIEKTLDPGALQILLNLERKSGSNLCSAKSGSHLD